MNRQTSGSVILMALMVMSLLSTLLFAHLKKITFLHVLMSQQVNSIQKKNINQGLLMYGISHAKKHYDTFIHNKEELMLQFELDDEKGTVTIAGFDHGIMIQSLLYGKNKIICQASCQITQNSDKKFLIQGFQS